MYLVRYFMVCYKVLRKLLCTDEYSSSVYIGTATFTGPLWSHFALMLSRTRLGTFQDSEITSGKKTSNVEKRTAAMFFSNAR